MTYKGKTYTKKQKDIKIDSVPKSYFIELQRLGTRAIGKKINSLLSSLVTGDGENIKIDNNFKIVEYSPLVSTTTCKPILYSKAMVGLQLAIEKFSTEEWNMKEMHIINQVIYQDFHGLRS